MKRWIEIALHLAFWLFCLWILHGAFAFESVEISIENGVEREVYTRTPGVLPSVMIILLAKAFLFYGAALYVLPEYFVKKQWRSMIFQLGLLFLVCQLVEWGLHGLLPGLPVSIPVGMNLLLYLLFLFAAFSYRLSKDWWRNERQRAVLAREKLAAELNYLKAQLNPHFLFNTLNNLYALAEREGNEPLSEGIAGLAELMRYAVYDSRANCVPLAKELRFLQSMVELQSLRFDDEDEVDIAFRVSGAHEHLMIAPLLLVPFVENAFKHGIHYGRHSVVQIEAVAQENNLHFKVVNTTQNRQQRPHEEVSGVGLKNACRRLELLYPEKHFLEIEQGPDTYSIDLQLELDAGPPQ